MPGTWITTNSTTGSMNTSLAGFPTSDIAGDVAQTFYIDPQSVLNSRYAFITSIDLYFYGKPNYNGVVGTSGLPKPGVTIFLTDTKLQNGIQVPDLDSPIKYGWSRKEWDDVVADDNGDTATTFNFSNVPLETDYTYAIVVKFDGFDNGYSLWRNKSGETFNNVVSPSITKGALDGYFFALTNGTNLTAQADTDLKFAVKIAKFSTTPTTYKIVNRDFEIFRYTPSTLTGVFVGGEPIYANTGAVSAQTVAITASSNTITGTGTTFSSTFTANGYIVVTSGTNSFVRKITAIGSDTSMTVKPSLPVTNGSATYMATAVGILHDHYEYGRALILAASTSNTSTNFAAGANVVGSISGASATISATANTRIDEFAANFNIFEPPGTSTATTVKLANATYNTVGTTYQAPTVYSGTKKRFNAFPAYMYSKTDEVRYGNGSVGTLSEGKSVNFEVTMNTDNPYCSPLIDEEELRFNVYTRWVNNDLTNEHIGRGAAVSKYVSRLVTLAEGHDSEDIVVFADAFRPATTDVVVYAKFYNPSDPESVQSKNWTRLEQRTPATMYSNKDNLRDLVEIQYRLPKWPVANWTTKSAGNTLPGTFTVVGTSNTVLTGSTSTVNVVASNGVTAGDLIRLYAPAFPNNSLIATVTTCNTTSLTIDTTLTTANTRLTSFVTSGMIVERVSNTAKNTAFSNYVANGVCRYYNSSLSAFDTYKVFQLKVVLTGTEGSGIYPYVDGIRGIAVSV